MAELIVARLLGAESYGVYVYILALAAVAGVFSKAGLDIAAQRFVSTISETGNTRLFQAFLRFSRRRVLKVSMILAGLVCIGVLAASSFMDFELRLPLMIGAGLLICLSLSQLDQAILYGLRKSVLAELPLGVLRPALILVLAAAWLFSDMDATAEAALLWALLAAAASLVFGRLLVKHAVPANPSKHDGIEYSDEWRTAANAMVLGAAAGVALDRSGVVVLGLVGEGTEVGQFGAALRLSSLLAFFVVAVNSVLAPMIAAAKERRNSQQLQGLVSFASRIMFSTTLLAAIVIAISGEQLLALFGREFVTAHSLLLVLLVGQVANAFAGPVVLLLNMTGNQRDASVVLILSAALSILLNLLFIPSLGGMGAAIATSTSIAVWNMALSVVVWKRLGIVSIALPWRHTARS